MSKDQIAKPSVDELKNELKRENSRKEYRTVLRNTVIVVIVVAALSVLISSFFLTVLKVTGDSMTPTMDTGQIVIAQNSSKFEPGELIAFYYNNKVLVKRVVGSDRSFEPTDITYPYQVPENRYFVLGDHRSASIDSRSSVVGCVTREQLIGKVFFRVYPFDVFGAF